MEQPRTKQCKGYVELVASAVERLGEGGAGSGSDRVGAALGGVAEIEERILEGSLITCADHAIGSAGLKLRRTSSNSRNLDRVVGLEGSLGYVCDRELVLQFVRLRGCLCDTESEGGCEPEDNACFHILILNNRCLKRNRLRLQPSNLRPVRSPTPGTGERFSGETCS